MQQQQKSRILEALNLLMCADSSNDTKNAKRVTAPVLTLDKEKNQTISHQLSLIIKKGWKNQAVAHLKKK